MKKKTVRILIIVLAAALIFGAATFLLENMRRTTYVHGEVSYTSQAPALPEEEITDEALLSMISKVFKNSSVKDKGVLQGLHPDVNITLLSKSDDRVDYGVYIDSIFKRSAYVERHSDGAVFKLTPTDFTELFSTEIFAKALGNTTPLKAYLLNGEPTGSSFLAVEGYPYSGTWNYAGADGKQLTLSVTGEDKEQFSLIENSTLPFSLHMAELPPELMTLTVYEDGQVITRVLTDGTDIPNPGRDGFFVYELSTAWPTVADVDFNGSVVYRFYVSIDLDPTPSLSKTSAPQGSVITVRAANGDGDDAVTATCEELGWTGSFTLIDGTPTALMGIPLSAKAGDYTLKFNINGVEYTEILTVTDGSFPSQQLSISTTVKQSWIDQQEKYLTPLREYVSAENYITGPFIEPATGKITTKFGTFRYTNGALEPTRHNGIDIADRTKPDVLVPMDGVVVFTMNMYYTGKTVVIDHGMNVLSYFYHLDTIEVEEGDTVTLGQTVGRMGTTGYSTGVHLHYTVMVNGVAVDPNIFYQTDVLAH